MNAHAEAALRLHHTHPEGRYLQAPDEMDLPTITEEAYVRVEEPPAPRPPTYTTGRLQEATASPLLQATIPWKRLALYPLGLAVALGLIYLAFRLQWTATYLFPAIVLGVVALWLAVMAVQVWFQERDSRERRQRLRRQMAGITSPYGAEEDPGRQMYERGMEMIAQGDHEEAIVYLRKALQLDDRMVEAYQALGTAYNALGEPELAVEMTQRAFELKARGHADQS